PAIAPRYDLLNDLQSFGLHRYWKHRLVRLAGVRPGAKALDLCCGTGDLAGMLAEGGATVVGVDFTTSMLQIALRRKFRIIDPKLRAGVLPPESARDVDKTNTAQTPIHFIRA